MTTIVRLAGLVLLICGGVLHAQPAEKRLPVPSATAQSAARETVDEVFGDLASRAKNREQRIGLAERYLEEATATQDDPAAQFVLLELARKIGTEVTEPRVAFQAIDQLAKRFEFDASSLRRSTAIWIRKELKAAEDLKHLAETLGPVVDSLVEAEEYEAALVVTTIALDSAVQSRSTKLIEEFDATSSRLNEISTQFAPISSFRIRLQQQPADPDANLAVGKFLCFMKGDFVHGVPLLARGSDEELKTIAEMELVKEPQDLQIGDAWWRVAESLSGLAKANVRERAIGWYDRALPKLEGLNKNKVARRIIDQIYPKREQPSKPDAAIPNLAGTWRDDGNLLSLQQRGNRFSGYAPHLELGRGKSRMIYSGAIDKAGQVEMVVVFLDVPEGSPNLQRRSATMSEDGQVIAGEKDIGGRKEKFNWSR